MSATLLRVRLLFEIFSQTPGTGSMEVVLSFLTPMDYLSMRLVCKTLRKSWDSSTLIIIFQRVLETKLKIYGADLNFLRNIFPEDVRDDIYCILSGSKILEVLTGDTYIGSSFYIFFPSLP